MKSIICILIGLAHCASAELVFESTLQEVNAPAAAVRVSADFTFTNRGTKPVHVAKVDPDCTCISYQIENGKLDYAPGESGVIRTEIDMGNFTGVIDKNLPIWLDDDPDNKPSVQLTMRIHIPQLVVLEPKTVKWEIGDASPRTIRVTMHHDEPIHVTNISSTSEAFQIELKTVTDGSIYDIQLTPKTTDKSVLGMLTVKTDCKIEKHRNQQGYAVIQKPDSSKPANAP
jgi:hypothetical protein